jgi:hypothetical protein
MDSRFIVDARYISDTGPLMQEDQECSNNVNDTTDTSDCDGVITVQSLPYSIEVSTALASTESTAVAMACTNIYSDSRTMLWAIRSFNESACLTAQLDTDFEDVPAMAVISGNNCNMLQRCIAQTENSLLKSLDWTMEAGTDYFLVVALRNETSSSTVRLMILVSDD